MESSEMAWGSRGRVLKEEDGDRDLRMNKHHCPNSCPRGSALPFSGDLFFFF